MIEWVKKGLYFCLFSSIIMMICPDKKYYKHLSMVMGLLYIIVMIHPISVYMKNDTTSYINYLKHLILFEGETLNTQIEKRENYERIFEDQLIILLKENNYDVTDANVYINNKGEIERITLDITNNENEVISQLNQLLKSIYGRNVIIQYE